MAIVWPCPLAVDAYVAAGRDVGFPRPACPACAGPLVFWSGTGVMSGKRAGAGESGAPAAVRAVRVSHALLPRSRWPGGWTQPRPWAW